MVSRAGPGPGVALVAIGAALWQATVPAMQRIDAANNNLLLMTVWKSHFWRTGGGRTSECPIAAISIQPQNRTGSHPVKALESSFATCFQDATTGNPSLADRRPGSSRSARLAQIISL